MDRVFAQVSLGRPLSVVKLKQMQQQQHNIHGSYGTTGMDLLRFQRNFVVHVVDYLKVRLSGLSLSLILCSIAFCACYVINR